MNKYLLVITVFILYQPDAEQNAGIETKNAKAVLEVTNTTKEFLHHYFLLLNVIQ